MRAIRFFGKWTGSVGYEAAPPNVPKPDARRM
jgi:hypothetical protein